MEPKIFVQKKNITQLKKEAVVIPLNSDLSLKKHLFCWLKKKRRVFVEGLKRSSPKKRIFIIKNWKDIFKSKYVICVMVETKDLFTLQELIRKVTVEIFKTAYRYRIKSIAFPALESPLFSYKATAKIMAQEVFRYLREKRGYLKEIIFTLSTQKAYDIFKKNVLGYINYMRKKMQEGPFLTVDGIVEYRGGIVMVERSNPPFGWALPGGFVDYAESAESAVVREIKEETNLDFVDIRQFKVYSQPQRDPRFHTVSVVFTGKGKGTLKASSDAKNVKIFKPNRLPQIIAFDHRRIIQDYLMSKDDKD